MVNKKLSVEKLKPSLLRWQCKSKLLNFKNTNELEQSNEIQGQQIAWEALIFGIECKAKGQNVYVRGESGTGRKTMIRQLLETMKPPANDKLDRCYVHNFSRPERPRLISLKAGTGSEFRNAIRQFSRYIVEDLGEALNADYLLSRRTAIQTTAQEEINNLKNPLEDDLKKVEMALVSIQSGQMMQTTIFPVFEGKPIAPEQFMQLVMQGKISKQRKEEFEKLYPTFQKRLHGINRDINSILEQASKKASSLNEHETRQLLSAFGENIKQHFDTPAVATFIDEIIDDVINNIIKSVAPNHDPNALYDVNVLIERNDDEASPIINENTPNLINLLGTVEPEWGPQGPTHIDYRGIHAGSLLRSDGGYLILEAKDIVTEPGAWRSLTRTLRTGQLEIVPSEIGWLGSASILKPEPICINVRVILLGNGQLYYQLDRLDPDFSDLFKVLADFDYDIPRNESGIKQYISVINNIIKDEGLLDFSSDAVASAIEHGARIVSHKNKLSAKFGRIADIIREAAYLAKRNDQTIVEKDNVEQAIQRTKKRASLPSRRFQELVNNGTIIIETQGERIGQINGLAVIKSGPIVYGFPARITATIAPGKAGVINIEDSANMSGSIHTKGFNILGGLLRELIKPSHPMAFSASIAFEQSYGGIDGDSASGAEFVCLISALTNLPIKQSIAMTGAIDQHGHLQAIGGANEKIEGFFDSCNYFGLTGDQGVIIPKANAGDLMLRHDVVNACEEGKFNIYAVATIHEAIHIATGVPAGSFIDDDYTKGSVLQIAREKIRQFWQNTLSSPKSNKDS